MGYFLIYIIIVTGFSTFMTSHRSQFQLFIIRYKKKSIIILKKRKGIPVDDLVSYIFCIIWYSKII